MKKLVLFLFTIFVVVAFFCGQYFAESQFGEVHREEPPRVFIEQLKTKMNITKSRDDIEIFLNGEKMTQDVKIDVKR